MKIARWLGDEQSRRQYIEADRCKKNIFNGRQSRNQMVIAATYAIFHASHAMLINWFCRHELYRELRDEADDGIDADALV